MHHKYNDPIKPDPLSASHFPTYQMQLQCRFQVCTESACILNWPTVTAYVTHVFNHEPNVRHQIRYHCAVRQEASSNQMQLFRFQVCAECTLDWQTVSYMHAFNYEPNVMNNLPYKTGLDVMQSHPLHRTRFSQCQASSAACVTV